MDSKTKKILLEAAVKIGKRICSQAIWQDGKCTWEITTPDMSAPKLRKGIKTLAGSTVYQGTSGIAIFLSELFRITKEDQFLNVANGAVRFALDEAQNLPKNSFGFHSGKIGIGYSAFLLGHYSQNEHLMKDALNLIYEIRGHENEDRGIDVIGGAGGAIQPLLKLYELTKEQTLFDIAVNLGEALIKKANMEIHGWSWSGGNSNYRDLCGYAHGASGIGHAFLELYNQTNSDYYLYAAEQAFLYERQFYNTENNNWPDFRYTELSEYTSYNKIEELKEALINDKLPPYQIHCMSAWCHGAPGIGLSRLRAYGLTGNYTYKEESINACTDTIKSLINHQGNYSLCHGFLGNAETLLVGSKVFRNNNYLNIVINKAIQGIENFENNNSPWSCGTMNSVSDPSLLLGESGIGHFLLRIIDEDTISVLAINSNKKNNSFNSSKTAKELQQVYINKYFPEIISLISKIENKNVFDFNFVPGGCVSDVETACTVIENYIKSTNGNLKQKLEDLFLIEKEKYISYQNLIDYSKEYLEKIVLDYSSSILWNEKNLLLSSSCKLITRNYNWSQFQIENKDSIERIAKDEHYYIIYLFDNKFLVKEIDVFLFVILNALQNETSYEDILTTVLDTFDLDEKDIGKLQEKINMQLNYFYKSGMLKINDIISAFV